MLRSNQREDRATLPRVIVLGGGFAGVYTAYRLQKELKRARVEARIGIVNRENFFVFYPMLPEIISGSIGTENILNPIRFVAKNSTLFTGEVTEIDLERRSVGIQHGLYGHRQEPKTLYYDHLVIALGGVPGTQDVPGMNEHAFNVQRMSNAFALRNHLIDTLEQANALSDRDARRRLLTYVVVGGGPSGVEVAGELEHLVSDAVKYYRTIRPEDVRVILVHAGDRLLPTVPERLSHYTAELLARRGVEIIFNRLVTRVETDAIMLSDGRHIETATVVGSLGLAVNPLVVNLPLPHDRKGAVIVHESLLAGDFPNVWAIGDNASVIDPHTGKPYPPTAQHAVREAGVVAHNIAASLTGRALKPIDYHTKGRMVPLGGHSAVAEIYGITADRLPGLVDLAHLLPLPAPRWEKRLRVMFDWTLDLAPTAVGAAEGRTTGPNGRRVRRRVTGAGNERLSRVTACAYPSHGHPERSRGPPVGPRGRPKRGIANVPAPTFPGALSSSVPRLPRCPVALAAKSATQVGPAQPGRTSAPPSPPPTVISSPLGEEARPKEFSPTISTPSTESLR